MISVAEAKNIVDTQVVSLPPRLTSLSLANGKRLATDVYAPFDIPAFPQSSVDGYAISFDGWKKNGKLKINGEIVAGSTEHVSLLDSNAARVFTGAPVPVGSDTIVMQEKVEVNNGELTILDAELQPGRNVRPQGSEINAGALALEGGFVLTPMAIGFLAGIGIPEVNVFPKPSVSIITNGKELQQPGQPLAYGQVYESNSFALIAALQCQGFDDIQTVLVGDSLHDIVKALDQCLEQSDVVIICGGISVGDYDFVLRATAACGVSQHFYKVKQRPGKPLYFGTWDSKPVFGLPGNPSSAITCFYQYVLPALNKISNLPAGSGTMKAPLANAIQKAAGLTHFLKGYYDGNTASSLHAQESYRQSSFARANCLIEVGEDVTECREGEPVDIYLLPV